MGEIMAEKIQAMLKKNIPKNESFSAETTLQHLGGNRFIAMTGANNFLKGDNFISFKLPNAKNGIKYVKVELDEARDLYNMTFMNRSGNVVKKTDGLYFDQLQEVFTENTGLDTHL